MKKKFLKPILLALSVFGAVADCSSEIVLDIDFSSASKASDVSRIGTFRGVLPVGVNDNFSSWSGGRCTAELVDEDGIKYLRFIPDSSGGGVQFSTECPGLSYPGFFRLTVQGRVRGSPLRLSLRQNSAPYKSYSSHSFGDPDWGEKIFVFPVREKAFSPSGLYLYMGTGEVHLRRIKLEKVNRADLVNNIARPPRDKRVFVSRRFLLGLPNGWNDSRETEMGSVTSFSEPDTDIPVLKLSSGKDESITVWAEPFQTGVPQEVHTVSFRCRGTGEWKAQIVTDIRHTIRTSPIKPAGGWKTHSFTFKPDDLAKAFAIKFTGTGELFLDDVRTGAGKELPARAFAADCALAAGNGEISEITRIWFTDEKPRVRWAAAGAPAGARLKLSFTDLYGRPAHLADIALKGGGYEKGEFDPSAAIAGRTGQFRITAEIFADGKAVSAPDEFIFTRVARPAGWGRDMPDSPFGIHMLPRPGTLAAMKACGINWTRFHDAATSCTGWWALEPEKGKWKFRDDSIARFRKANIKIFAQLGTAPAWATHFNDLGYKHMGYFEKYLRPVDTGAWVNYVRTVVKRYRGTIDEYFVWNEPWGTWWKSAGDLKYYDASRTAQDFAVFQALTYKTVKAVDPAIRVSGFNTYASAGGAEWTAGVDEGGGWDACDIVDYHVYTPDLRARRRDSDYARIALKPLLEKYPKLKGKPVYMSEGQGTSTGSNAGNRPMSGLYERTIPWEAETPREMAWCSDATCRYTLSLLAAGDRRVFLYTAHGYMGLVAPPGFTVLVGADGYPYPSLAAYAFFTRAIEGAAFISRKNHGANGLVYEFRHGNSNGGTVKLYTDLTAAEADALNAMNPLKDLYGNPYEKSVWFPGTLLYSFK